MTKLSDNYNLQKLCPDLAKEWHPTKNGKLKSKDVTTNSGRKVWWVCSKNKNHKWEAIIADRNNGNGCPYCSGRKVCIDNCLKTINSKLAKEWHPKKNDSLTPKDVTPNSRKKVWWLCSKNENHEWDAIVGSRNMGRGCPYCSGRSACIENCLTTINPKLAREWHPTKNGSLTPKAVFPNSSKKAWWLCSKNKNHKWEATIKSRSRGAGCKYCPRQNTRIISLDNCLTTINPKLAREWHPTKNGSLTPRDVNPNSHKKVWWLCSKNKNHKWEANVLNRNNGTGCPYCFSQTSALELSVYTEMKYVFQDFFDVKHRKKPFGYECDVYIPKLKLGIEIDSVYAHKFLNDKYVSDKEKTEELCKKGIMLLRLREKGLKQISNDDICWAYNMPHYNVCCSILKKISDSQKLNDGLISRIRDYLKSGKKQNEIEFANLQDMLPSPLFPEDSLEYYNKTLAKEWHPTKNGTLTPRDVFPYSNKKVWWLCSKNKNHKWEARISKRNNGRGCPYCSGRKVCIDNCLETINPKLAREWHPTKNGSLTPKAVFPNSSKKAWWLCSKNKNHKWEATIKSRSRGAGCKYCPRQNVRIVRIDNCLKTINPRLAKEWHPTKNGTLAPRDVFPYSNKKVWWLCSKNKNHEWVAVISSRNSGRGCPYCSGRKVCNDNCLKTINPRLAKEWHSKKNDSLTPRDVTPNSNKKVWWLCSKNKNHEWNAQISSRNKGTGCPYCFKKRRKLKHRKFKV